MSEEKKLNIKYTTEVDGELYVQGSEVITLADIDTELSLDSSNPIANKIFTAKLNELEDQIEQSTAATDDVSIKYNEEGQLTLNPVFLEYLQNATYVKPSIKAFTPDSLKANYIVGEKISSSSFTHYESEIGNIKGNLVFTITGGYSENITPVTSSTAITLAEPFEAEFKTHGQSVSFKLSGTDVKGNAISTTVTRYAYYPFYHGTSTANEVNAELAKGLTCKTGITPGTYTYTLSSNSYVYWFTTTAISSIKDTNGNVIDYVNLDDLTMPVIEGGADITYKVYRTSDMLVSGSWKFTIA